MKQIPWATLELAAIVDSYNNYILVLNFVRSSTAGAATKFNKKGKRKKGNETLMPHLQDITPVPNYSEESFCTHIPRIVL